ncbi:hypothetical protein ACWD4L_35120 [Streptomyces sp. NPDC002596]
MELMNIHLQVAGVTVRPTRDWAVQQARAQLSETVCWAARAIWRRLDCLKPNLQKMQVPIRRKDS